MRAKRERIENDDDAQFNSSLFLSPLFSHLHVDQRQEQVARLGVLEEEVAVLI